MLRSEERDDAQGGIGEFGLARVRRLLASAGPEEPTRGAASGGARGSEFAALTIWDQVLLKAERLPALPERILEHEILTSEEEFALGVAIQEGLSASDDPEVARTRAGRGRIVRGAKALGYLVRFNIRLVRSVVLRYRRTHLDYDDLMSYGVLGVLRAAEKFEPGRAKFSTYAVWWIRQSITRGIDDGDRMIRIPAHLALTVRGVSQSLERAGLSWGSRIDEVPDEVLGDLTREKFSSLRGVVPSPYSLGDAVSPEEGEEWWSTIADPRDRLGEVEDDVVRASVWHALEECIGRTHGFSRREFDIVRKRFGAVDDHEWTLDEIGKDYGVSRERIRQIVNKVMGDPVVREALAGFVDDDALARDREARPLVHDPLGTSVPGKRKERHSQTAGHGGVQVGMPGRPRMPGTPATTSPIPPVSAVHPARPESAPQGALTASAPPVAQFPRRRRFALDLPFEAEGTAS